MALCIKQGGRESNSFVTLVEATSILATFPDDTEASGWDDAAQATQELCLELAAKVLSHFPWRSTRRFCGQALCFPRKAWSGIPTDIKRAQVFIAHSVVWRALSARPPVEEGAISNARVTGVSLGGMLSVTFSNNAATGGTILDRVTQSAQFPAYMMLTPYLTQVRIRVPSATDAEPDCSTTTTTPGSLTTTTTVTTTTITTTTTTTAP